MTEENATKRKIEVEALQWTGDLVQNFWNYQSRFPENYFTSLYGDRIADAVRRYVPRGARILDYACGTGALTGHLLDSGFSVGACDLSPDSVAHVQKKHGGHSGFCGASTIDAETVYCPCCNHTFHRWQHVPAGTDARLPHA